MVTHQRWPNYKKVKYAYMCNLTSEAQHAGPIWESTQKTLSSKSKARLHRYVPTLAAHQNPSPFLWLSLFIPLSFFRENIMSCQFSTLQKNCSCCCVIFSRLCIYPVSFTIFLTTPQIMTVVMQSFCRVCLLPLAIQKKYFQHFFIQPVFSKPHV